MPSRLLTIANIKSFTRDRAALFWTLAFPLIFVVLFGSIFSGGSDERTIGFADQDGSPASQQLATAFELGRTASSSIDGERGRAPRADEERPGRRGHRRPAGLRATVAAKAAPATVTVYTDPSQSAADGATRQLVGFVLSVRQPGSDRAQPPAVQPAFQAIQTNDLSFISYLVPSILGMSLMQLGIFAAIPLVADRQKLILKRLQRDAAPALAARRQQRPRCGC